jgi:hypothetical protein
MGGDIMYRKPIALIALAGLMLLGVSALAQETQIAQARQDPYVRYPAPAKPQAAIKSLVGEVVNPQGAKLAQAVLNRDADYEVHAEHQGTSSATKSVSHFDDRDEIFLVLEVPTK